jgi:uncharacterized protein (UPF0276 family)
MFMFNKPNACLGVGINYRNEISDNLIRHLDHFDFIEIGTERFFIDKQNPHLATIMKSKPVVLHGLTLSLGTQNQAISELYLKNLTETLSTVNCAWFSEHIAVTSINGVELRSLMPVEFTASAVERIAHNVKKIKAVANKPFLLENITYYYAMPMSEMSEANFISQIASKADCGLLLDLNNLYVNAFNHQYDPYEFIHSLPLDRIVEIHLAGCDYMQDMLIDTHASAIRKDVLNLFDYLCRKTPINGVVIERDARLNHFSDLINEVQVVRDILRKNKLISGSI